MKGQAWKSPLNGGDQFDLKIYAQTNVSSSLKIIKAESAYVCTTKIWCFTILYQ